MSSKAKWLRNSSWLNEIKQPQNQKQCVILGQSWILGTKKTKQKNSHKRCFGDKWGNTNIDYIRS
jgi:hypothetical protein